MTFRGLWNRLGYLGYLGRMTTWRWLLDRVDYTVLDHLRPLRELHAGRGCLIHPTVVFREAKNISLGDRVRIQPYACLWASPGATIEIGDHTGLGPGTLIFSSNHQFAAGRLYHDQPWTERNVRVGRDVWVGAGSIILPGVTIGDGSVVAAGSVVTRDVAPGVLVGGVPAHPIKARSTEGGS